MTNFTKTLAASKLLIFSLIVSNALYAKPNSNYQVELIVFKNINTDDIYKENWPRVAIKIPDNAQPISSQDSNDSRDKVNYYTLLPPSDLAHAGIVSKLKRSSSYSPIAHLSWLQPKKDFQNSKTIYFTAGANYKADPENPESHTPEISGTIKFTLKKYVHASLDLLLNLPVNVTNNPEKPFTVASLKSIQSNNYSIQPFAISEQRRLKNGEVNYFDNPAFGAILIVKEAG